MKCKSCTLSLTEENILWGWHMWEHVSMYRFFFFEDMIHLSWLKLFYRNFSFYFMFWGQQIWDRFYTECVGGIMWENVFPVSAVHVFMCVSFMLGPRTAGWQGWCGPTHSGTPQLFWLCVLYKDFITQCFREVFTLTGESKCQWHSSQAQMSSVNKQGVSLAVLLLPADSLCQRQTRKCQLSADSCLCCAHTDTCGESPAAPYLAPCTTTLSAYP